MICIHGVPLEKPCTACPAGTAFTMANGQSRIVPTGAEAANIMDRIVRAEADRKLLVQVQTELEIMFPRCPSNIEASVRRLIWRIHDAITPPRKA